MKIGFRVLPSETITEFKEAWVQCEMQSCSTDSTEIHFRCRQVPRGFWSDFCSWKTGNPRSAMPGSLFYKMKSNASPWARTRFSAPINQFPYFYSLKRIQAPRLPSVHKAVSEKHTETGIAGQKWEYESKGSYSFSVYAVKTAIGTLVFPKNLL